MAPASERILKHALALSLGLQAIHYSKQSGLLQQTCGLPTS